MILTRSKKLTVRMGDYESFTFEASVSMSHADIGLTDKGLSDLTDADRDKHRAQLSDLVNSTLDTELQTDIEDALEMGNDRNSFLQRAFGRQPLTTGRKATRTRSR